MRPHGNSPKSVHFNVGIRAIIKKQFDGIFPSRLYSLEEVHWAQHNLAIVWCDWRFREVESKSSPGQARLAYENQTVNSLVCLSGRAYPV